jgi:hypothetical protein
MILGLIGATGFVFGVGLFGNRPATRHVEAAENAHDSALYGVGWLVMLAGIAASVVIVAQHGGLAVFSLGYLNFGSVFGPTMLPTTVGLSYLGCLLAVCGAGRRRWVTPLALWGVFIGIPVLLTGSRAAAMIPLVGFAIVLTHRGVRFRRSLLLATVLTSSFVIPAVEAFRLVGFSNRSVVNWTEVTPLDTLLELGGSLRAVKTYVDWIEEGDEYLLGASYWAPIDRQLLVRVVPGREQIPYEQDKRVPARLMESREGAVGASSTGEAYYNFGPVGPFIYFACVGALFGWLERRAAATSYGCAFLGVTMFLFYFNIRGDWLPIPAQVAEALALLGGCYILGRFAPTRAVSA